MTSDYAHQCRYCAHCVCGDIWWCEEKSEGCKHPTRPNRCDKFLFNEIPADDTASGRVYKPRKKSQFTQLKLFVFPTDKQRQKISNGQK